MAGKPRVGPSVLMRYLQENFRTLLNSRAYHEERKAKQLLAEQGWVYYDVSKAMGREVSTAVVERMGAVVGLTPDQAHLLLAATPTAALQAQRKNRLGLAEKEINENPASEYDPKDPLTGWEQDLSRYRHPQTKIVLRRGGPKRRWGAKKSHTVLLHTTHRTPEKAVAALWEYGFMGD